MGREAEYSDELIIETGLFLESRGRNANSFSISTEMGGGNLKRIRRIWKAFKEQDNNGKQLVSSNGQLPAELELSLEKLIASNSSSLGALVTQMWCDSRDIAEVRLAKSLHEHEAGLEHINNIELDADKAIDMAEFKIVELESKLEAEKLLNQELHNANAKLEGQMTLLQSELTIQKEIEKKHNELTVKCAQLESEVDHMRRTSIFYPSR